MSLVTGFAVVGINEAKQRHHVLKSDAANLMQLNQPIECAHDERQFLIRVRQELMVTKMNMRKEIEMF